MKPIINQIEAVWGGDFKLHLALPYPNLIDGLMAFKTNHPKYALDEKGKLVGLNLSKTGLTDEMWSKISTILTREKVELLALDLSDNKLTEFVLSTVTKNLEQLNIEGNTLDTPTEGIFKQGTGAVLRFFRDLQAQGESELFEVKMLIVGEGGTGKTTLWNLLQNPDHPVPDLAQKSTIGIQIKEGWTFPHINREEDDFIVNLWDFGGQDIQYMTHQFFLTNRSFYVLLADGRREVANFPYWLQIIELLGCAKKEEKALPVLVVLNEKGNPISKMPYDAETVKKDYPKLDIIRREVDFGKKDGRMDVLTRKIKEILCEEIPHLPLIIPAFWAAVREELYVLRENVNHICAKEFADLCAVKGIEDQQQQDDLSQMLHDLGVILHFKDDIKLADFIILSPQWAVNAVYEIMRHEEVKTKNQGRFDEKLLQLIWKEKKYTAAEQGKLLNLMLKNNLEVCFSASENGKEIFIAPQLLPEQQPANLNWKESTKTLPYVYHYPFMPKGLIGRLIVRLNEAIEVVDGQKMVWEKGMLMKKDGCQALIHHIEDKDQGRQIIKIEVKGKSAEDRKNILRDIRQELNGIHGRSFTSLKVYQKVPCNCSECEQSTKPFEHDYDKLQKNKAKNANKAVAQCGVSFESMPVDKLLGGIFEHHAFSSTPHIRSLVKRNKIKGALEELDRYYPNNIEIIHLNGQWGSLQTEIEKGIISFENRQMKENQIRDAILSFLN